MHYGGNLALVVEDEPLIQELAIEIIDELGHPAEGCATAEMALELLEEKAEAIGLVLTDINLAGERSGLDLAREVSRRWPQIGLVIMSGHVCPAEDALPKNACFLPKPWLAFDLAKAIKHGLRQI